MKTREQIAEELEHKGFVNLSAHESQIVFPVIPDRTQGIEIAFTESVVDGNREINRTAKMTVPVDYVEAFESPDVCVKWATGLLREAVRSASESDRNSTH